MNFWRCLVQFFRWIVNTLSETWRKATSPSIVFDTGRSVRIGKQIAEGGFSYVFEAFGTDNNQQYALKRIHVGDQEAVQATLREAGVHRSLRHPHLMPCFGVYQERTLIYLLFPYMAKSLRSVVNKAVFESSTPTLPFTELQVLQLFYQILTGVQAMHQANISHRDIKLENILLNAQGTPVLMDFGSAGPLMQEIQTRSQILNLTETAAQHTTLPYRPPELLEGGVRSGDAAVDFTKVDVWSLGCTLFAMCYGASPFECEFKRQSGDIRIVDCSALRILGNIPTPPAGKYSPHIVSLMNLMLTQDRHKRPTLDEATAEIELLIQKLGARVPKVVTRMDDDENESDLDALLSSNRFV